MILRLLWNMIVFLPVLLTGSGLLRGDDQEKRSTPDPAEGIWRTHVEPLLKSNCRKCHNGTKKSGQLDLSTLASTLEGGKKGPAIVAGEPDRSLLFQLVQKEGRPHMPPAGKQLSEEQLAILANWIRKMKPSHSGERSSPPPTPEPSPTWLPPENGDPTTVIDLMIQARWKKAELPVASRASDDQFVRRIYLDLVGRIPTLAERQQFIEQRLSDKRVKLVDLLLNSEEHANYLASVFDTLFMGRGDEGQYTNRQKTGWNGFLQKAFLEDRPWDQVVRDILLARPRENGQSGSTWFLYERNNKHQEIAEAIGPAVFGLRIECAQCHDHPLASEIEQRHYWGLVAFFRRGKNVNTPNGPRISESAIGGFEEFSDLSGTSHPNFLVFFGREKVNESRPAGKQKDDPKNYLAAGKEHEPKIPRFSRRQKFVDEVLARHPLVARAMVNRLWALLMGRGLVHPFDKIDSAHPPSHPILFEWLSRDFEAHGYRPRRLIRALVLSQAYQLDSRKPAPDSDPALFSWSLEKPLVAEAWTRSIAQLLRNQPAANQGALLSSFRSNFPEVLPEEKISRLSQAMFLSNGESLQRFISESGDPQHLRKQLLALPDHSARINQLYRAAFSRQPDPEELTQGVGFLEQRSNQPERAIDLLLWAIVTSSEFRINH